MVQGDSTGRSVSRCRKLNFFFACRTDEVVLTEVLLSRSNEEMNLLKNAYHAKYRESLEHAVAKDFSGKTERCTSNLNRTALFSILNDLKQYSSWLSRLLARQTPTRSTRNKSMQTLKLCTRPAPGKLVLTRYIPFLVVVGFTHANNDMPLDCVL